MQTRDLSGTFQRKSRNSLGGMTTIYRETDADPALLDGKRVGVVGYGNQGRSWALNLRDSGVAVSVHVRNDETRAQAEADGFAAAHIEAAGECDVVCLLVPDDVIPHVGVDLRSDALAIVASGFTPAFGRLDPGCDVGMVAPRMLGPEVRRSYEEGVGFITAVGVHRDVTGAALALTLAVAHAIGGLRQGALALSPEQEAVLDLAVEQLLSPALARVTTSFVEVMSEAGIPIEAVLTELYLSGEVERNYRLLREEGFVGQLEYHSPTSQYGQLSRRAHFAKVDAAPVMRDILAAIVDGRFADEWDAEAAAGMPQLADLKEVHAGELIAAFEADLRSKLGQGGAQA